MQSPARNTQLFISLQTHWGERRGGRMQLHTSFLLIFLSASLQKWSSLHLLPILPYTEQLPIMRQNERMGNIVGITYSLLLFSVSLVSTWILTYSPAALRVFSPFLFFSPPPPPLMHLFISSGYLLCFLFPSPCYRSLHPSHRRSLFSLRVSKGTDGSTFTLLLLSERHQGDDCNLSTVSVFVCVRACVRACVCVCVCVCVCAEALQYSSNS